MGLLTPPPSNATIASLAPDHLALPEVTMLSEGLRIRVGQGPDDLCLIEELSIGDPVWDAASQRLVDIETMSCATLSALQLAEMGLLPTPVPACTGTGWFALSSSRLIARDPKPAALLGTPRVFFRLWPETRLQAEVEGRQIVIRAM